MRKLDDSGFTIVELMISTAVFSTVLVGCAVAMITIGRQLHKAEISVATHDAARTIIEEVGRQMELSSQAPTFNTNVICVGSIRYTYSLNTQVENTTNAGKYQDFHGLWRDIITNPSSCNPAIMNVADPTGTNGGSSQKGQELLPLHTRLTRFSVKNGSNSNLNGSFRYFPDTKLWDVDVAVLYGDNDVIINKGVLNAEAPDANCVSTSSGGAFCALSQLHTTVFRRLK